MIKKGSSVKITTRGGLHGTVVSVDGNFVEVAYQDNKDWFRLSQLVDTTDEILGKFTSGDLDDELEFKLAMDAYRLRNAQSWEPYVLAASNKIDIFPHQIDELTWILDHQRALVADEVGLGKTIIAALVTAELRARGIVKRVLYVVPKSLILKWNDELEEKFEVKSTILSSSEERVTEETFQRDEYSYIASIDYLKQDHIMRHLKDAQVDMVVVDEAHKLKPGSQRFVLGEEISRMADGIMFLTATPHDGKDENFLARMKLLDPWVSDVGLSSHLWVRNMKEDVVDINGDEVFPKRKSRTHKIPITKDEERIYEELGRYLANRMVEAQTQQEQNAVRFLRNIFLKRCSSSIASLEISLNRRLEKLGTVSIADLEGCKKDMSDADEQFDEAEFERSLEIAEALTVTRDLEQEKSELKSLIEIIKDMAGMDSKLRWLDWNVSDLKRDDRSAKLIIFTEYKDTMFTVRNHLSQRYSVGVVYGGGMTIEDRKHEIARFRDGDVEILVCTDAAGEGLDMQFCNIEINYDLPWNPNKIEQRMGRIHRIGQTRDVSYHNYVIDNERSTDGYIQAKLLDKIDAIKTALDDKVYDMFGSLVKEADIEQLREELARTPYAKWEPKMRILWDKVEENKKKIQMRNKSLLTAHRFNKNKLDDIKKIRKRAIDLNDVKRFFTVYCDKFGGKMDEMENGAWRIFLPKNVASETNEQVLIGTFEKEISAKKSYAYIALGNRFVTSMLKNASKKAAAVLSHRTRSGMMFVYRFIALNKRGAPQGEKILFLFHNEDGTIDEVGGGSLWAYEPAEGRGVDTGKLFGFYERADGYADGALKAFEKKTLVKTDSIRKNTERMAHEGYGRESDEIESKIREYKQRRHEGPHMESLITRQEKNQSRLRTRLEEKLRDIATEFNIDCGKELVGAALVIPDEDATMRNRVGIRGEELVCEYEKNRAKTEEERGHVRDVSRLDSGYDIESFGGRCIEVKSFDGTGLPTLTSHEWETAKRIGDDYYLYVVENVFGNWRMSIFRNPYKKFSGEVIEKEVTEYRYEIRDWKAKADERISA